MNGLVQYEKIFIDDEYFNSQKGNNTSMSSPTIGQLAFDKWLFENGWKVNEGAIRNAYHPQSRWFNPITKETILINVGIQSGKNSRTYYIEIGGSLFEVPVNVGEFELFKKGYLKLLFS